MRTSKPKPQHIPTAAQLRKAAGIREKIEELESQFQKLMSGESSVSGTSRKNASRKKAKKKRTMSPEGRARIAAAARKRWAEAKKQGKTRLG